MRDRVFRTAYHIQVLDRAFSILDSLEASGGDLGVSELTTRVGLQKSTVHRLLSVLGQHRYVAQSDSTGKYRLGYRLSELGRSVTAHPNLVETAEPFLQRLVEISGETAHVGALEGGRVLSLAAVEGSRTLRTPSTVGKKTPVHSSSIGKCLLAFLSKAKLDEIVRTHGLEVFTATTIATRKDLNQELARVRNQGFAIDEEEYELGLKCLGAPVRDSSGTVSAAISIAGPASRLSTERTAMLAAEVKQLAREFSVALGWVDSELARQGGNSRQSGGAAYDAT